MPKGRKKTNRRLLAQWLAVLMVMVALGLGIARLLGPGEPDRVPGIDVSSHQGAIDWQAVADSGVEFAMVRLGYRSMGDGSLHEDARARENLAGARAAGLKVGAYFFSQAVDPREAAQEAAFALDILAGDSLDLPLAYDWEHTGEDNRAGGMEPDGLTACVHAFCGAVEAAGYQSMVYFNQELSQTLLDLEEIRQYPFWYARYGEKMDLKRKVLLWQYSDQGTVPGISENVDLNWWYPE